MNVGFVHLGCSKNLIDTEAIIGKFKNNKYKIVNKESEAEILVINTCGFIESAKEEAVNTILEMIEYKKQKCRYLIVIGCLVQRYYKELIKSIPEVDLYIKIEDYDKIWDKIENLIKRDIIEVSKKKRISKIDEVPIMPMFKQEDFVNRVITTGKNYAYLKIGEGCSNRCTYCAIPYIRGPFVSRKMEDIIEEAKELSKQGIKELIIIAQDTTKYGIDIYGECKIVDILKEISKIENIKWIRVLYMYPEGISDELIDQIAANKKIAKYFDIPIQHISDNILKKMNRKTTRNKIEEIIKKIRVKIPDAILRTSLIVGFPGETEENFKELIEFVEVIKFDKLGVFEYSKEEGTPASKLQSQIHGNTKKSRYNKIMSKQQIISKQKNEEKIGNTYIAIIENISFDNKYYIGRTIEDAPEIDGNIYIKNCNINKNIINKFVNIKIVSSNNYDYIAELI